MSELKTNVMKKVYRLYAVRRLVYRTLPEFVLMVVALYAFGREVFVSQVFQNAPSFAQIGKSFVFFLSAFTHTEIAVQATLVVVAIAGAYFLADLVKSVRTSLMRV